MNIRCRKELIYLLKKIFTSLREMNLKKSNLIEISKSSKKEHKHMHLINYLTQLKTHLFYHLISKCSSDLLNIDFVESVTYHWKKAKTKLFFNSIST